MKMKLVFMIVILIFIFYLSYSIVAQGLVKNGGDTDKENAAPITDKKPIPKTEAQEMEGEDSFGYDQDFFSRKLFQKRLPKLSKEEKITWAFKMAESNPFL